MAILRNRFFIGSVCFLVGTLSMYGFQKFFQPPTPTKKPHHASMDPLLDQFFSDDFFGRSKDPFEEMRRMRKQLLQNLDQQEGEGIFDSWYGKKFGGSFNEISQREDDQFLYYDLTVDGLKQDRVKVTVSNGQISISGQLEKKSKEGNTDSYFSSSFHRSFPVPSNVEAERLQMEQTQSKVTIKFPKKKAPAK